MSGTSSHFFHLAPTHCKWVRLPSDPTTLVHLPHTVPTINENAHLMLSVFRIIESSTSTIVLTWLSASCCTTIVSTSDRTFQSASRIVGIIRNHRARASVPFGYEILYNLHLLLPHPHSLDPPEKFSILGMLLSITNQHQFPYGSNPWEYR